MYSIVNNFCRLPISTCVQAIIRLMHCLQLAKKKNHTIVTDMCISLNMAWGYAETGNLERMLTVFCMAV